MDNPYAAPSERVLRPTASVENTSGMGKGHPIPEGVMRWCWGAFCWNWIWAIGNRTWIGLLALVPYAGFIMAIVLGLKGREWAWQNKRWESVEQFNEVQRKWGIAYLILMLVFLVLMAVAAVVSTVLDSTPN